MIDEAAEPALRDLGQAVIRRAQRPNYGFRDRSGRLRRSIRLRIRRSAPFMVRGEVSALTEYASYVEETQRGRYSYLRRAFREEDGRAERVAEQRATEVAASI